MSKYSRTRKAICRISHLMVWPVDRTYFRKTKPRTWKDSYKRYKKDHIKFYGYNKDNLRRYIDMINDYNVCIWQLPGISSY